MKFRKILIFLLAITVILVGFTACVNDKFAVNVVCDEEQGTTKGTGSYKTGETVEVSAEPKDGYIFDKWSDNETSQKRTITVSQDVTYTALFKRLYKIEVQCDTSKGTVTGGGEFVEGTQINISVSPKGDNALYEWNDGDDELNRTVTVTQDFTYIAEFIDITNFIFEKETGTIKGFIGDPQKIIIPKYIYDIKVNEIGDWAFYDHKSLSIIRIPDSVTRIGDRALSQTALITVEIPSSVTILGNSALSDNPNLISANIPNSVTEFGGFMFYGCKSLKSVTLPSTIESLERETFSKCTSLTDITLPDSIKYIGDYVFYECGALSKVTMPKNLEKIGYGAFSFCTSLSKISLPQTITDIKNDAFYQNSLTEISVVQGSYADTWCIKNKLSNVVVYMEP